MDISDFLEEWTPAQQLVARCIHDAFVQVPGVHLKSKYKLPFYYRHTWIAYINPLKSGGLELCFTKGYLLSNDAGLLHARGRTMISGVTYMDVKDIDFELLSDTFQEALIIDEQTRAKGKKRGTT